MSQIKQAVILSAGLGTRLRSVVKDIPKVMAPFEGKPILEHHIEQFKKHGVTEFFINLHYLPDVITNYFGDGSKWGVRMDYFLETPDILGTAGGMKDFDGKLDENFFLMYGDMFSLVDYKKMGEEFLRRSKHAAMVLIGPTDHPADSDLLEADTDMRFKKIWQKPHAEMPATNLSMLAAYVFNRRALSYIPERTYYEIDHQLLPDLISKGEIVSGYTSDDYIMDIGTP
ncbi:MAG: nucleotidyltransferase family protein, partial [Candidatus Liptonbacteria bacterium]